MTAAMAVAAVSPTMRSAARIEPFAPSVDGLWCGRSVTVRHVEADWQGSRRLRAQRRGDRLVVEHRMTPNDLCDQLATTIVNELGEAGLVLGQSDFEEVFTGVVRSTVAGPPMDAWLQFYVNSVNRLENGSAGFAPVHDHAEGLIRGEKVIDLGSCFGFFPLRLAARGIDVTATDLSAPTMDLLARMTSLLGRPVRTLSCDASAVPLPDGCADTVTALHLIEHVPPAVAGAIIGEALRLARRRVIIAVPFEDELAACYGHVQRFDRIALDVMSGRIGGQQRGWTAKVLEHHGGWLVVDR